MKRSIRKIFIKNTKKKSICEWCNHTYYKQHNSQKYCSEQCSENARLDKGMERARKYRKTYNKNYSNWVGSGYLGKKRSLNEEEEIKQIKKELKRLKLKVKWNY